MQVTDKHFKNASKPPVNKTAQNPTQYSRVEQGIGSQMENPVPANHTKKQGFATSYDELHADKLPPAGLEPVSVTSYKTTR